MKSLLLLIFAVVGVFGQVSNVAVEVFAPYVRVSGDAPTGLDVNAFRLSGGTGMSTFLALCDSSTCNGFTCTAASPSVCTANTNITSFVDGTLVRIVTSDTVGGRTFAVGAMSASTARVASIATTGQAVTAGDATAALTTFVDATVSVTALTSTPGFTVALSQEASVSMLAFAASGVPAGQYILMGWGTRFPLVPVVVIACIPGTALTCSEFTCDTARVCSAAGSALGSITGTATASAVTYSYPTASLTGFDATMSQQLWLQSATGTAVAAAQVQLFQNNVFQSTPVTPFTGTAPSFGFTAAMESATSTRFTVTPASGNYAAIGFGTGANTFPSTVAVCDPANVETCSLFTCTGATTCAAMADTTGYTQTRNVGTSNLVVTNTALGTNPILYWLTAASTTINAALIQGQTWTQYRYPVSQLTTVPSFPVAFSRPSDTTLSVTLEPGSTSTVYFGWRMNAAMTYPVDAVVCSPSTVTTCLDVSCTSATTCVARTSTTTIYTSNSASGSSATLTRALASGNAPLSATKDMYLAWDLKSSTTATLAASEVQTGRTWRFYSAQVPSVGSTSSAFSVLPSVLTMLALVVYML